MIKIPWASLLILVLIFLPLSLGQNSDQPTVTIRAHYDNIGVGSVEDGSKIIVPDLPDDAKDGQEFKVTITSRSDEYLVGKTSLAPEPPRIANETALPVSEKQQPGFESIISLIGLIGVAFMLNYGKKK